VEAPEPLVLVVIDGLDASGKSTQALKLEKSLRKHAKTVFIRIHPTNDNLFGTEARHFLYQRGKGAHFASAIFYMFDVVRSIMLFSWQKYDYVIFVRYLMGTAYLPSPIHRIAYQFFASVVPKSDYMFFLDVSPEEADKRIRQTRKQTEMFETLEQLKKTRNKALFLAQTDKWRIIDAGQSVSKVEKDIETVLQPLF
jgi:dTMP kinase